MFRHKALRDTGLNDAIEHPVCIAACLHWPLDRYAEEGRRETEWFVPGVVKYHRTLSSHLNGLIGAGFAVQVVDEPGPTAAALQARPELASHLRRPPFLVVSARAV